MKNRLIGILVLLLIFYIGSPIIFGVSKDNKVMTIKPEVPEYQSNGDFPEPDAPERDLFQEDNIQEAEERIRNDKEPKIAEEPKTAPTQYPIERLEKEPKQTKKASVDPQGVPVSWTLQVASFEDDKRAQAFVAKLKNKGYKSYSKQVDTSIGPRVRVYAGPSMDKAKLLKTKQTLDRDFKLKSLVLRFTPDS